MKTLIIAIIVSVASASAAQAISCKAWPRSVVTKNLQIKHKEQPIGVGISKTPGGKTMAVELFASKDGTFSVLLTFPDQNACVIAAGESWTPVKFDENWYN